MKRDHAYRIYVAYTGNFYDVIKIDFEKGLYYVYENGILGYFREEDVVLEEYTGLKDRNGKKIYDGDIIDHFATKGYVIFEDGMFCLNTSANSMFGSHKQPLCYLNLSYCDVIGNIHDDKELMGVGK